MVQACLGCARGHHRAADKRYRPAAELACSATSWHGRKYTKVLLQSGLTKMQVGESCSAFEVGVYSGAYRCC